MVALLAYRSGFLLATFQVVIWVLQAALIVILHQSALPLMAEKVACVTVQSRPVTPEAASELPSAEVLDQQTHSIDEPLLRWMDEALGGQVALAYSQALCCEAHGPEAVQDMYVQDATSDHIQEIHQEVDENLHRNMVPGAAVAALVWLGLAP